MPKRRSKTADLERKIKELETLIQNLRAEVASLRAEVAESKKTLPIRRGDPIPQPVFPPVLPWINPQPAPFFPEPYRPRPNHDDPIMNDPWYPPQPRRRPYWRQQHEYRCQATVRQ